MKLHFTKMHGCGNDFILIDHRDGHLQALDLPRFISEVCRRKYSIGANGLMLLEHSDHADFKMRYFNADGSIGEMCGNGARCIAKFAYLQGVVGMEMTFETLDGTYRASVLANGNVAIYFPNVDRQKLMLNGHMSLQEEDVTYHYGVVGVPHTIVVGKNISNLSQDIFESWGQEVRYQPNFSAGTNVNLVEMTAPNAISIRTYERGVEEETLACGTGACASAILVSLLCKDDAPYHVQTQGGMLHVNFSITEKAIEHITLSGGAEITYEGVADIEKIV